MKTKLRTPRRKPRLSCKSCFGSGRIDDRDCMDCRGNGWYHAKSKPRRKRALVRRIAIDWKAIAKESDCTNGTLARSPVFGWGVRGNGPADFCCITPPTVAANEELRIEEGMWAVYAKLGIPPAQEGGGSNL